MFWQTVLVGLAILCFILIVYIISEFAVYQALKRYEIEKKRKPINQIYTKKKDT